MDKHPAVLDAVFHALSDPTRRAVLGRLGEGSATISELAEPFDMALPSFMKHIGVLERSRLIITRKTGRVRTCALDRERLIAAERWFGEQRLLWQTRYGQLDALLADIKGMAMKPDLRFEFVTDRSNGTVTVEREFDAGRQLVWDCHTRQELLDRWFAPKGLTTKTKHMDFRDGGYWHYAMVAPDGQHYWSRLDYLTIEPIDRYTAKDGFCDEAGTLAPDMPRADWTVTFTDVSPRTLVTTVVRYASLDDLQKVIDMGFEDGMASTLERLDELLPLLAAG